MALSAHMQQDESNSCVSKEIGLICLLMSFWSHFVLGCVSTTDAVLVGKIICKFVCLLFVERLLDQTEIRLLKYIPIDQVEELMMLFCSEFEEIETILCLKEID